MKVVIESKKGIKVMDLPDWVAVTEYHLVNYLCTKTRIGDIVWVEGKLYRRVKDGLKPWHSLEV